MLRTLSGLLLVTLLGVTVSGCLLQNMSADERLRDSVLGLNDEVRWTRLDLASMRVAPAYRAAFAETHRGWGRAIQIADMELMRVALGEGNRTATSIVTFRWYSTSTMTLRESTVKQEWARSGNGYALTSEEVVDGDPLLLPMPEPVDDAGTAGDEAPAEPTTVANL